MQQRLFQVAVCSIGVSLAVCIPLSLRLAWTYEAEGYNGLRADPLTFWLPLAVAAAVTTYFAALTILLPKRYLIGTSVLFFGLTALLASIRLMFHKVGSEFSEVFTPFVVHLVSFVILLTMVRVLRYRLANVTQGALHEQSSAWRFPVADLLLLTTGLAVFFTAVHQFEYFWYAREGDYHWFLIYVGFCIFAPSFATVWATLGGRWLGWVSAAIVLVPVCLIPARQLQVSLIFPIYWLPVFVAMYIAILAILLFALRLGEHRLIRIPAASRTIVGTTEAAETA